MMSLPAVPASADLGGPPEPYASPEIIGCDPTEKPGVVAFRAWVLSQLGGGNSGVVRDCSVGKPSDHHDGRAWDWRVDASNPEDQQRVRTLFDWLFAGDAEGNPDAMFRRAGLMYVIWDRMTWKAWRRDWLPYTGYSPHTDHVHFSFGKPGAMGETSFFRWLGTDPKPLPLPRIDPVPQEQRPEQPIGAAPLIVGASALVLSGVATYYAIPRLRRAATAG